MLRIASVAAVEMRFPFAKIYGEGRVPRELLSPASHFQRIKRTGQAATLVVVTDRDGVQGVGECFGLPSPGPSRCIIEDVVAPALAGADIASPEEALDEFYRFFVALGNGRGAAMEALAGVDIALWDLISKRAGQPLATMLGGAVTPVPVYASPVPFLAAPAQSAAKALAFLDQGYTAVKLKIGRGAEIDAQHVRAIREAMPPGTSLMLDANCAYDLDGALALVDRIAPYDIAWLEEPVAPEAFEAMRILCERAPFPIAGGENDFTLPAFERLASLGVSILQPNVTRALGVTGMQHINAVAERTGVDVALHGVGTSIGVATALHCCAGLPKLTLFERNDLLNPLRDDVGVDVAIRGDGCILPPSGAGHGGTPRRAESEVVHDAAVRMALHSSFGHDAVEAAR
ncbi:mandelate racemase/muconate lactonizing enzyme family protein [Hephaestia sp. GCM10023244]|uniref:mandelate racemase/muconate lactonizing enzyme family protein n=1 Tax=unclassified Hephaestia TaxID=2631281 RepID=UPI002076F42A|nr:mandelate racemase/muconate lactonizing enzyme family protein [Hephaestia sp. MAHUQ-44]MCM8732339.1 mandelate racemase/muconate lactonizing enzyme family protein [Hephaestia sp. MAHUQ-44]